MANNRLNPVMRHRQSKRSMITQDVLDGQPAPDVDSFPWNPSRSDLEMKADFDKTDLERANTPFYTNTGY